MLYTQQQITALDCLRLQSSGLTPVAIITVYVYVPKIKKDKQPRKFQAFEKKIVYYLCQIFVKKPFFSAIISGLLHPL